MIDLRTHTNHGTLTPPPYLQHPLAENSSKCIVKQTQPLFSVFVVDKHLQAFHSDIGRMKISRGGFCMSVCGT